MLLILVDDMGFGASSPYGGPCRMPVADRLADEGLRFTRFHVTSLCSPTRAALLSGRNHHSVGMGVTTEMTSDRPGYTGRRPPSAATLAQVLSGAGYATAAFGKWHQTPPADLGPYGPYTYWPRGEGFDRFYGFMGAEMNHWYPQLYDDVTPVEPARTPAEGYHLTEDLVDHADAWIREQVGAGEAPFFAYVAFGATHAPFHVAPEWIERYRGEFDRGWDDVRATTLARQKELGVVPPETVLSPWPEEVPRWDDLDADARAVAARFMETYAGFAEHTDAQVGRLIGTLDELGVAEDTLVLYLLGDNGASGEGGLEGTVREHLVGHGGADDVAEMAARLDEIGSPSTYGLYPAGWALAMNTPYQWTKQIASHHGGNRDGAIVRWPAGVTDGGSVRHQWHHVIDVMPTILEAAGVAPPAEHDGVPQQPVEGTSMAYAFADPDAPDTRTTQYFEMVGNRGVYADGWTAVTRHGIPWKMAEEPRPFDDDVWELYDTTTDWSQARDLAAQEPERLAALQQVFAAEAARHQVFPLDDRVTERENPDLAPRPDPRTGVTEFAYGPGDGRLTEEIAPNVKNRSHRIEARVGLAGPDGADLLVGPCLAPAAGPYGAVNAPVSGAKVAESDGAESDGADPGPPTSDSGVLVAQGGAFGGWSLYLHDGRLCYVYNLFGRDLTIVRSAEPVCAGERTLALRFDYDGGEPGGGADLALEVDGAVVGRGRIEVSTPFYFSFDETFNVGVDRGTSVSPDYVPLRNAFTGRLDQVRVLLADDAVELTDAQELQRKLAHE